VSEVKWRFDLRASDGDRVAEPREQPRSRGPWREAWQRLKRNRTASIALWFLVAFGAVSLLAPLLPLPSPVALELQDEPQPPVPPWTSFVEHGFEPEYWTLSAIDRGLVRARQAIFGDWQTAHWLGTDGKGRDLLSRIVWGSRISIGVGLMAALTSLLIGVTWGAIAGLAGGRTDKLMMRFVDVLYSLPFIFVVIFLVTIFNGWRDVLEDNLGIDREVLFYVAIGAVYWLTMARVVRGQVLSLRHAGFVEAARAMGASTTRILFVHILPNVMSVVVVYLTLSIPAVLLFETFLTFLGLGIEAPKVSWGSLAIDGAEAINPLRIDWWLVVWPAVAMGTALLALNVLGDGMRDALDPTLRDAHRHAAPAPETLVAPSPAHVEGAP
jgi:oligopeptide transport system permease protein